MKTKIFLLALVCVPLTVWGTEEHTQTVSSPVESAIVYLIGAELTQSTQVNMLTGRNKIIVTGISSKLVSKSVRVEATGNIVLLSVTDHTDFLVEERESGRVKQLKDSLKTLSDNLKQIGLEKNAYEEEKKMLINNESLSGKDKGVVIADLKLAADFYRSRIKEINAEIFRLEKKEKDANEILTRLNNQLTELNAIGANRAAAEITLLFSASAPVKSTITIKYLVTDAGWAPSYDIISEDVTQLLTLKYKAKVFNNTGVDWNDIKMRLSTADPTMSAAKPVVSAWYLNYNQPSISQSNYEITTQSAEGYEQNIPVQNDIANLALQKKGPVQFAQIQIGEMSADFDIKLSYSIPSDAKPYIVDVTEYKLKANYSHFSVPKIDRDAFLIAKIADWEDLELVEGPADIYVGGSYSGQSYIYTRSVDDTLDLSLGRDKNVVVTRTKLKDFSSVKLLGSNRKETYAFEIAVKNNHKSAVTIEINDQIPVSQNSEITVEVLELSKADYDPLSGKLKWLLTLQPGETQKLNLSFSVKYPKNKTVYSKKKYRSVSCPSF